MISGGSFIFGSGGRDRSQIEIHSYKLLFYLYYADFVVFQFDGFV